MKIVEVKKEDLLTELGKKSRIIKMTVLKDKSATKEVSNIPIGEIVDNMTRQQENEFFFKVIMEESDNE